LKGFLEGMPFEGIGDMKKMRSFGQEMSLWLVGKNGFCRLFFYFSNTMEVTP
jgi:hypothetical protein